MNCRWDKFIWCVRLIKTRKQANDLISKGKVSVNSNPIKPSKEVHVGSIFELRRNNAVFSYKVLQIPQNRLSAKLVQEFLLDLTSDEEKEKFRLYQTQQSNYRQTGTGRPDKHDREAINRFYSELDLDDL